MTSKLTGNGINAPHVYIQKNVALGHIHTYNPKLKYIVQPMTRIINGKTYTILYNGNIYNSDEIKETLIQKGYVFLTNSDAEIVLISFIEYGAQAANLFNGGFAYTILDNSTNTLFLVRDKLGIQPLFYYNKNSFIFASEIKGILEHPNVHAKIGKDEICEIFGLGPAHTPGKTFFKDICEILPGHYGIYNSNGLVTYKYWDLNTQKIDDSIEENISHIKELVEDSLKRQLKSDLPICSMLSGGLDSSVLAYLTAKEIPSLQTFSIDFEENESNFSGTDYQPTRDSDFVEKMTKFLKTNHTNLYFSSKELFDNLKDAMIAKDMPGMADVDSSMLVFCKKIKDCGYDIAISGECSDEIFGGYPWYYKEHLIASQNFPWSRSIKTRSNILNSDLISLDYFENYISNAFKTTSNNVVYNSNYERENTFRKTCYNTIKWFMNTLIERTSRMSRLAGLEVRIPFADYRIFEYVYNISYKYKLGLVANNDTPIEKYLLRKAFENDIPHDVVYRKKSPFPKTYDPKYTKLLEDSIKNIINKSTSPILEIVNVKYLYEMLNSHGENLKENWFGQLMTYPQTLAYLIQINMWLEEYNIEIDL